MSGKHERRAAVALWRAAGELADAIERVDDEKGVRRAEKKLQAAAVAYAEAASPPEAGADAPRLVRELIGRRAHVELRGDRRSYTGRVLDADAAGVIVGTEWVAYGSIASLYPMGDA